MNKTSTNGHGITPKKDTSIRELQDKQSKENIFNISGIQSPVKTPKKVEPRNPITYEGFMKVQQKGVKMHDYFRKGESQISDMYTTFADSSKKNTKKKVEGI